MTRRKAVSLFLCVALALSACTANSPNDSGVDRPENVAPPPESPLSQVRRGMGEDEVRELLGPPATTDAYMTGKSWIPFYFGSDTARSMWRYQGQGRVVFSRNQYSGELKVVEVFYEPTEPGH
jgi:outer membrane protein assembly factor BamE (lipoprotein component of BamABCDE complex)